MHFVYILYSEKIDKYYIGETHNVTLRLERHNADYYENKWTKQGQPWILKLTLACTSKTQAQKIEQHIKRMKSKKYILNLISYSEMQEKLLNKHSDS